MPKDVADELADLVDAAGPFQPPDHLLDEDADREHALAATDGDPSEPAASEAPAPEAAPPETEGDPAPVTRAEIDALRRELDFARAAAQAPPTPAAPLPNYDLSNILPLNVTDEDIAQIVAGGPRAVEYVRNALAMTAYAAKEAAKHELSAAYQQVRTAETTGDQLRRQFYGDHPDLEPYAELVGTTAQAVVKQYPQAPASALMQETAARTRAKLAAWGVQPGRTASAAPAPKRRSLRPARADAPSRGQPNGRTTLSALERDIVSTLIQ